MLVEPPFHLNGSEYDPPRWRQMNHACGENPTASNLGGTRMDTGVWDFRTAKSISWPVAGLGEFPDDLAWEALVDVLRGRVKVHNHWMTFVGATESHLIVAEITDAGVGPPLTRDTTLGVLLKHNVSVAIGIDPFYRGPLQTFARNARFDAAWAALEMDGEMSSADTLALASVNVASLLGLDVKAFDLVATKGGTLLEFESKVVGVISSRCGGTDIL
ncbi:hypothetical protein BDZ89DRAFT_1133083 [Hymenopellis radicata]|nr:hypothetical protein BDZ89DRAFT_1133083 [Hymenopellis radicata]